VDYNTVRSHSSLRYLTPVEFAARVSARPPSPPLRRSLPALGEAESGKITCLLEVFPYGVADCREHTRASL
jgi:hypothetical protein